MEESSSASPAEDPREKSLYRIRTMAEDLVKRPPREEPRATEERKPVSPPPARRRTPVIALLAVAVIFAGTLVYLYRSYQSLLFAPEKPPANRLELPPPFFSVRRTQTLTETPNDRGEFGERLKAALATEERRGDFTRVIVVIRDETSEHYAELRDVLSLFGVTAPSLFFTPVGSPLMLFAYYGADGPEPGLIVPVGDRERTLLSLKRWEETLPQDLAPLFLGDAIPAPGIFETFLYRNTSYAFLPSASDPNRGIAYMVFPAGNYLTITTSKESMERVIERLFDAL